MQLKTLTVLAASLAMATASPSGWGDHTKAPVLDTTNAPSATKPVEVPTGKPKDPEVPVDGGKTDVADETTEESKTSTWADIEIPSTTPEVPVGGGEGDKSEVPVDGGKTDVADETATSAEESSTWADIELPTTTPEVPVDGGKTDVADETTTPDLPVDGGKTDVADETTTTAEESSTWADVEIPTTTPDVPVDGGKTDVADETASSTVEYWGDASQPVDGGETDVADETASSTATWGDHTSFPELTTTEETTTEEVTKTYTKPDGGEITTTEVNTKTITKTVYLTPTGGAAPPAETPVSGGQGGEGKPETPVSGGEGKGPQGPPAGGDECGTVTQTVTNVVTVTVPAGGEKPTGKPPGPPAPPADTTTPVVETSTFSATWQDQTTGFSTATAAPAPPAQGGYMGVVAEWRSKMGLPALEEDTKLQNNAQDAANSSGGQLKHKLNSGSMAQVMAPGDSDNFEDVFVGGWLCELPNTPGLGSQVCNEASKGWNYAGQTGHAEILISNKYTKIGCGLGQGIWCCDLA